VKPSRQAVIAHGQPFPQIEAADQVGDVGGDFPHVGHIHGFSGGALHNFTQLRPLIEIAIKPAENKGVEQG
jgi:hypothetical protein